jgi:hypothetical protein
MSSLGNLRPISSQRSSLLANYGVTTTFVLLRMEGGNYIVDDSIRAHIPLSASLTSSASKTVLSKRNGALLKAGKSYCVLVRD